MKSEIEKLVKIYNTDTDFHQKVDLMTEKSKTLNEFMSVIAKNVVPFLNKLFPAPVEASPTPAIQPVPTVANKT